MKRNNKLVNGILEESRLSKYKLDEIKHLLKTGQISYLEAQKMSAIPLDLLNKGMEIVAKKYGRKHRCITFSGYMR